MCNNKVKHVDDNIVNTIIYAVIWDSVVLCLMELVGYSEMKHHGY